MRIRIVTPAAKGSRTGNRVGANRWARLLRDLDHRVTVDVSPEPRDVDLLIALHARRSSAAIRKFASTYPGRPIAVVLTGTDLYGDVPKKNPEALASIAIAKRLVVLQPHALDVLPKRASKKARVILQSVPNLGRPIAPRSRTFDVCVAGHLRPVKDPMRAAMAARLLPSDSKIAVLHAGAALDQRYSKRAEDEMARNPRYTWLGELSHKKSVNLVKRSRAMVISSRAEGGAHVVSEALVAGTPVLASRVSGNIGMLGEDYPGLFDVGDTRGLASLMGRLETDDQLRGRLELWCSLLAPAYTPIRERYALRALVAELMA